MICKLIVLTALIALVNISSFAWAKGGYGHGGGHGGGYGGGYGRGYGGTAYVSHHQTPHHYMFGLQEHGHGHTKHHHQTASTHGGYGGGYGYGR